MALQGSGSPWRHARRNARALELLRELKRLMDGLPNPQTGRMDDASGVMGHDALETAGFTTIEIVHSGVIQLIRAGLPRPWSTVSCGQGRSGLVLRWRRNRTRHLRRDRRSNACARHPGGVKMYSGVFGITQAYTAQIFDALSRPWRSGSLTPKSSIWMRTNTAATNGRSRLYMSARTPFEPTYVQSAKALISGADEMRSRTTSLHNCARISRPGPARSIC